MAARSRAVPCRAVRQLEDLCRCGWRTLQCSSDQGSLGVRLAYPAGRLGLASRGPGGIVTASLANCFIPGRPMPASLVGADLGGHGGLRSEGRGDGGKATVLMDGVRDGPRTGFRGHGHMATSAVRSASWKRICAGQRPVAQRGG